MGPLHIGYLQSGPAATGPPGGIGGREFVMFIRPSRSLSVEVMTVRYTWEVEWREDDMVVAIHPFNESLEMELPALKQAVTAAHQARVAANGGRIGADTDLPMLVSDVNQLRDYYTAVGAYDTGVPAPTQPPPPCGLAVPDQADNPGLMRDCVNLLAAKDALRGTAALNWSVDTPISRWDGVTLGGTPRRVTHLLLTSKDLTGTIPPDLGRLDGLEFLRLSSNQLTGEIPAALGSLANLRSLLVSDNRLTGAVPPELGGLSSLEELWLHRNRLNGEIPAALGDLGSLRKLTLAGNRLSGAIPSDLGDLSNLEDLWLNYNQLTGEIPAALGNLSNLQRLLLGNNQLTGEIPAALGDLSNLQRLLLGNNQLTGCIPPALQNVDDNDLDTLGLQDCAAP